MNAPCGINQVFLFELKKRSTGFGQGWEGIFWGLLTSKYAHSRDTGSGCAGSQKVCMWLVTGSVCLMQPLFGEGKRGRAQRAAVPAAISSDSALHVIARDPTSDLTEVPSTPHHPTHTSAQTRAHTHSWTHTHTHTLAQMHVRADLFKHAQSHSCTYTLANTNTQAHTRRHNTTHT
jgi:hypothetical protein